MAVLSGQTGLARNGRLERNETAGNTVYDPVLMIDNPKAEDVVGEEWAEWYRLTPAERFRESMKLWDTYLALGGSLEPEPDTQSPFFDEAEWRTNSLDGPGVRVLRRGGV